MSHTHDRADVQTQLAALAVARAILNFDSETAATATLGAGCPVCLVMVTAHMSFGLAARACGETGWPLSEELRLRLLASVDEAERELGAAQN